MNKIKAIVVGCGKMGRIGLGYLYQKGIDIVGAIDVNPALEGKNLSEYAGLEEDLGIMITSDLEGVLNTTDPDVAVCAMFSSMEQNEPIWNVIIDHKVDIITTCDESHYSWNTAPEATQRLDRRAKENGVSLVGCGFQDVFWVSIVYAAAGAVVNMREIQCEVINNTEDYGPALADAYKVGLTVPEFEAAVAIEREQGGLAALSQSTNEALCAKFGLTPLKHEIDVLPYIKDHDIYSEVLGRMIPAGDAVGTIEKVTTQTKEGISIVNLYNMFAYDEISGEYDLTAWHIKGDPDVDIELPKGLTAQLTMSTIINRIPDTLKATPGYHPNCDLDAAVYHHGPFLCG